MLCDDDDFIMLGYLERMVVEFVDVDFVYVDVEIVLFEEWDNMRYLVLWKLFVYMVDYEDMWVFFMYVLLGSMYRCFLYDMLGYFDLDVYNYWDWDFYLCAVKQYCVKCVFCVSVIYVFFEGGGNQFVDFGVKWKQYLDWLSEKYGFGEFLMKNFVVFFEELDMKRWEVLIDIVWDGKFVYLRLYSL